MWAWIPNYNGYDIPSVRETRSTRGTCELMYAEEGS